MTKIVLGIYNDRDDAENAIERLRDEGYNPKDISILMKDAGEGKSIAEDTGADVVAGTVSGATTGAILGGFAGLLSSFVIPGLGAFFIGGPLATALGLTGAAASTVSGAATGALAGGLFGGLTGLGLSDADAKTYEERINQGGILVAVPARLGEEAEVEQILYDTDAADIKSITNRLGSVDNEDVLEPRLDRGIGGRRHAYAYATAKGGKSTAKKRHSAKNSKDLKAGSKRFNKVGSVE